MPRILIPVGEWLKSNGDVNLQLTEPAIQWCREYVKGWDFRKHYKGLVHKDGGQAHLWTMTRFPIFLRIDFPTDDDLAFFKLVWL